MHGALAREAITDHTQNHACRFRLPARVFYFLSLDAKEVPHPRISLYRWQEYLGSVISFDMAWHGFALDWARPWGANLIPGIPECFFTLKAVVVSFDPVRFL